MARCTVARSMRDLGLEGARRGKKICTTVRDDGHDRAADVLQRDFTASGPKERWVADFTYVAPGAGSSTSRSSWTCSCGQSSAGPPLPASGPNVSSTPSTWPLWCRDRAGTPVGPGLVHHSDAGSQYTSSAFTVHLLDAGTDASIGTVGDALDNALMESRIGLYKTELINSRRPWHGLADVELGAAEWVEAGRRRVVRDVGVPSGHPETPLADGIRDSPSPS